MHSTLERAGCVFFPRTVQGRRAWTGDWWGLALWRTSRDAHKGSDYAVSYLCPLYDDALPVVGPRLPHFRRKLIKASEELRNASGCCFVFRGGDNPTNSVNTTAASEGPDWWCWGIIHSCYRFVWSLNPTSSPEVSNWFCVRVDIRIIVFFLGMIEL